MKTSSLFFVFMTGHFFCFAQNDILPRAGSIILTEIFPDPTPSLGLPEKEFIEIYNAGKDTLQLKGYNIHDEDKVYPFPAKFFLPHSYLILCKSADAASFKTYGEVLAFPSFVSLNNDYDSLTITNSLGEVINYMTYSQESYLPGRTMENNDFNTICTSSSTWNPSLDSVGGTPGRRNSNYGPKTLTNTIPSTGMVSASIIELIFDFPLQDVASQNNALFKIDHGNYICYPLVYDAKAKKLQLQVDRELLEGSNYHMEVTGLKTCISDTLVDFKIDLLLPSKPDSADIIINEILFNPYPNCPDFIELYNASDKMIDLKNFKIANIQNNQVSNIKTIFDSTFILAPQAYIAITPEKDQLQQKYPLTSAEQLFEAELPSWNDIAGSAILLLPNGKICDSLPYNENLHMPLFVDREGISLERISFSASTSSPDNWHSAASGVGFATPGRENSQILRIAVNDGWVVEPVSFSPDGDGYKDYATIQYSLSASQITSLNIYDTQGRLIKKLGNNIYLASQGFIQWDGSREDNSIASPGYYIVHIDSFQLSGEKNDIKKPVVITFKNQ